MKAERCFSTYFHAIPALSNCQENSCKKNAINLLCLLSYFTVIIPLGMALAYGASLCGRAQPIDPENPSPPHQLPEPEAPSSRIITTPETSEVRDYPGDLTAQEGKAQNFQIDKCDNYQLHSNTNSPTVQVYIRRADIFKSGAPVIVNAANTHLGGGGGIDGAIHREGGKAYEQAHAALKNHYSSRYTEGYASMIESGDLKQKEPPIEHVIVVAGPRGPSNSQKKESQLYSCYYNSLLLYHTFLSENIENYQDRRWIAFPSISTGEFKYPQDRAAAISIRAIVDFVRDYPDTPITQISIHFRENEDRLGPYLDLLK